MNRLKKNQAHKLSIILIVIITALVFGGGVFLFQKLRVRKTVDQLQNVGQYQKEKIFGDYEWKSPLDKNKYENVSWNKIITPRLLGFSPNMGIVEKSTKECEGFDVESLRKEGGICLTAYWLEIKTDRGVKKIDTFEKLKETFSPIENEAEAVSYLTAINSNLEIADDIPEGLILPVEDGYLVQLIYRNTFGCGSHLPTGAIFKITKNGEVRKLAYEKEKPLPTGEPALCVD